MRNCFTKAFGAFGGLMLLGAAASAQVTLEKDYTNRSSATIGTFQGINFREAGFSGIYPIAGTNGKEFWICSDRGVNIDDANANPAACRPTYDKMFVFPNYSPKIHRVRVQGDSVQILRTITMKRPDGTGARGVLLPTGLGSTAAEVNSTDTVLDCANFALKTAPKDTFSIDAEGIVTDAAGNFYVCEENGPSIWKMDGNGVLVKRYTPYAGLAGTQAVDVAIDSVFRYRKNNRGFENIAISPSGKIYVIIQSPILYPTKAIGEASRIHRILEINPTTNAMRMLAYVNDGVTGTGSNQIRNQDWKLGDMAAINDTTFLVLEAAARGTTDIKRMYKINISNATTVHSGLYGSSTLEGLVDSAGLANNGIVPVKKTLQMDLLANGWPAVLDKAEGVAIINDSTLMLCNDNDYGQTSPSQNGIATATTNQSHLIQYKLGGSNKLTGFTQLQPTVLASGVTGTSSSQAPYLTATVPGNYYTAMLTVGDTATGGYRMVGIPDGMGAFDNGDTTFTLVMNHELNPTSGVTRAHGATGAFVSKWIIRKNDLKVMRGSDLIQQLKLWNSTTGTYTTYPANSPAPNNLSAMGRFCSADLPDSFAFYNPITGKGTSSRIFMNGEETGNEGRGFAHIINGPEAGTSYELPYLGKFSWENSVASPLVSDTTVVAGLDDATPGQVYFYMGTKQSTGNEIEKAGLSGGNLYSIAVTGMLQEANTSTLTPNMPFTMVNLGQVQNMTGAALNTASNTAGATQFLRPEDGAWDPNNPADFYFATTNSITAPSRLWRARFTNPRNISLGGTITAVLDGTEGQKMLDNLTIDNSGHIILTEDVGGNTHIGKVWEYNIATDALTMIGAHDSTRFKTGSANFLTEDEEASGQTDVQRILGPGMFLIADQAHYGIPGELVEGGQLMAMYHKTSATANPEVMVQGNSLTITDGDMTPSTTDYTDFGILNANDTLTRSFVISNTSTNPLVVTDMFLSGAQRHGFRIIAPPAMPFTIAAGGSRTISLRAKPLYDSTYTAVLNIQSNDLDEALYSFAVRVKGVVPAGVKNVSASEGFDLFPNPAQNKLYVQLRVPQAGDVTTTVYDLTGKKLFVPATVKNATGAQLLELDIQSVAEGLYLVEVTVDGVSYRSKFSVKR